MCAGGMLETVNADMGTRRTQRGSFFMVFRSSGGLNAEGRLCKSGDAGPCWKLLECRSGSSFRRKQRGRSSEVLASRIEVGRSRFEVPGSAKRRKKQPHISLQCPRGVARSQSSMGTRHETPLPPRPGPQDGHDRNLFVAHLSANGGQLSSMTSALFLRCLRHLRFKMLAPPSF